MKEQAKGPERAAGARLVARSIRARWTGFALALLGAAGHTASQLLVPLVGSRAVDRVVSTGTTHGLLGTAFALVALGVLRAVGGGIRKYNASSLGARVGADLRSTMFQHLQLLSASFYERMGAGQVMSRLSGDALVVDTAVGNLPFLVQSLVLAVGSVVVLLALQPVLGAAVTATVRVLTALPLAFSSPQQGAARRVAPLINRHGACGFSRAWRWRSSRAASGRRSMNSSFSPPGERSACERASSLPSSRCPAPL